MSIASFGYCEVCGEPAVRLLKDHGIAVDSSGSSYRVYIGPFHAFCEEHVRNPIALPTVGT